MNAICTHTMACSIFWHEAWPSLNVVCKGIVIWETRQRIALYNMGHCATSSLLKQKCLPHGHAMPSPKRISMYTMPLAGLPDTTRSARSYPHSSLLRWHTYRVAPSNLTPDSPLRVLATKRPRQHKHDRAGLTSAQMVSLASIPDSTKHSRSRNRLSQVLVTTLSTILAKGAVSLGATRPALASEGPKKRSMVSTTPAPFRLRSALVCRPLQINLKGQCA